MYIQLLIYIESVTFNYLFSDFQVFWNIVLIAVVIIDKNVLYMLTLVVTYFLKWLFILSVNVCVGIGSSVQGVNSIELVNFY